MKRMLIAQVVWASVMGAILLWIHSLYAGCSTPPMVAEYGSSNVLCQDGTILAPFSGYAHNVVVIWLLGAVAMLLVRAAYRYHKRANKRTHKVKKNIGFR